MRCSSAWYNDLVFGIMSLKNSVLRLPAPRSTQ